MFLPARFLAPLLLALLLGTVTTAVACPAGPLRLLLPLALSALLHRSLFPLAARAFAVSALMTSTARAVRGHRTRGVRQQRRFRGGLALEQPNILPMIEVSCYRRRLAAAALASFLLPPGTGAGCCGVMPLTTASGRGGAGSDVSRRRLLLFRRRFHQVVAGGQRLGLVEVVVAHARHGVVRRLEMHVRESA